MTARFRAVLTTTLVVLAIAGTANAQRRGGGGFSRPAGPSPAAFHPMAPAPVIRTVPQQPMGAPVYRPMGGPVAGAPVYRPMGGPVGPVARPGPVFQPGYGRQPVVGVRPVTPLYPGARPVVTRYGRPPMGGYPGGVGVVRTRYPVYGGYAPLVTRYAYHPEYFSYIPGGIWFTQPDYLGMDSNVYLGQYRGFLDQVQQNLGVRVQGGELPADVIADAQNERNYIEQVIAGDVASTGVITEDERIQLRELADGLVALNNYQPQVDTGAYAQPDPNAQTIYQAPPTVDPNAYPQQQYPQQYPQPVYMQPQYPQQ